MLLRLSMELGPFSFESSFKFPFEIGRDKAPKDVADLASEYLGDFDLPQAASSIFRMRDCKSSESGGCAEPPDAMAALMMSR